MLQTEYKLEAFDMVTRIPLEWKAQNGLEVRKSRFTSQTYLTKPFNLLDAVSLPSVKWG